MCLASNHKTHLSIALKNLQNDFDVLSKKQSYLDQRVVALYHEIENGKFSGVGGFKKLKEL